MYEKGIFWLEEKKRSVVVKFMGCEARLFFFNIIILCDPKQPHVEPKSCWSGNYVLPFCFVNAILNGRLVIGFRILESEHLRACITTQQVHHHHYYIYSTITESNGDLMEGICEKYKQTDEDFITYIPCSKIKIRSLSSIKYFCHTREVDHFREGLRESQMLPLITERMP